MILHLPYASTCYDKPIKYYTQHAHLYRNSYHNATYPTIHVEWQVIMPPGTATEVLWDLSGVLWLGLSAVIRMLQLHQLSHNLNASLTCKTTFAVVVAM